MKKILVGFIMDGKSGGLDTYLLHFLEAVHGEGVQIDFLTNEADPELKQKLSQYHSRLFEIASLWHPLKQYRQVRYLLKKEGYEMVYFNVSTAMDCIAAFAAKHCRVPRRALHSHSGGNDCERMEKRLLFNLLQRICRLFFFRAGTEYYACSKTAGYWMYPARIVESDAFQVIYNAVDRERFVFYPEERERLRREMSLENCLVVGHVGNFCYQKNHELLIRIFREVHRMRPDSVLLLAGRGIRLEKVRNTVKAYGLEHCVRFLGQRGDVDRLLQAMDVFVLPSRFEGLPTVGIEAQCTGLPCVISASVTEETRITDRCSFVSLQAAPAVWAKEVLRQGEKQVRTRQVICLPEARFYDLEHQKEQLKAVFA